MEVRTSNWRQACPYVVRNAAALLVSLALGGMVMVACAIEFQTELVEPVTGLPSITFDEIQQTIADLTVLIETPDGSGSGFLFFDEERGRAIVLTNRHVVGNHDVTVCLAVLQECTIHRGGFRGSDYFDVAAIGLSEDSAFSEQMRIWNADGSLDRVTFGGRWAKGDVVFASGYPGGNAELFSTSRSVVTEGIIAQEGTATYEDTHYIEHGADVAPGSSGGPLFNRSGAIIGIITGSNLFAERLELAIPMDAVLEWMYTGVEPNLTTLPRILPTATPAPSPTSTTQGMPQTVPPISDATPSGDASVTPLASPSPTSTATTTPTPTPTPTPKPGSRGNPISLGAVVEFGDWEIAVTGFVPDAYAFVEAADPHGIYEKPNPDQEYVFVKVTGTYRGADFGTMDDSFGFFVVGGNNRIYEKAFLYDMNTLSDQPSVLPSGIVEGYVPFIVPSDEVDSLLLLVIQGDLGIHILEYATKTGYFSVQ